MPTDVETQLHALGERFRSEMTHVHPDEILHPPERSGPIEDSTLIRIADRTDMKRRRARWVAVAAAVSVLVLMGGLLAISQRNVPDGSSNEPPATASSALPVAGAPGPPGAMLLPEDLGMRVTGVTFAEDGSLLEDVPIRWYASANPRPELGPYLRVLSVEQQVSDDQWFDCTILGSASREVSLEDHTSGCLEHRGSSDTIGRVFVDRRPSLVIIEGQVTDDELLLAANHVVSASYGPGFEVADPGLPGGVSLTGIGWTVSDFAAASLDDAEGPMVRASWADDEGRSMFYVASRGNFMSNHRLGYETVTDITVRGEPGLVRTLEDQQSYVGVVWRENDMTYQVGSQGLGEDQLLDLIEQLHLATEDEWVAANTTATPVAEPLSTTPSSISSSDA